MKLTYKNESILFSILLVISLAVWIGLMAVTMGLILGYVLVFFLFYAFAHSAFISYLKGTGVRITAQQFPDLHERIIDCCDRLGLIDTPDAYLLHMGGAFNALATRFLGRNFIVLYSDIVDALEEHPEALNFYIGHEVGHIKRNHLRWTPVLLPAAVLPLLGAAHSRAREYTCDRHGLAACNDGTSAQLGLAALAAGGKRWKTLDRDHYVAQVETAPGFWMSLHELISDYPWLAKRMAALRAAGAGEEVRHPRRNIFAWLLALFIPRIGMGGGMASVMLVVVFTGMLAAVAIPAFQDFTARAQLAEAFSAGTQATEALARFYQHNERLPRSLEEADFLPPSLASVESVIFDAERSAVQVRLGTGPHAGRSIYLVASKDRDERIVWRCRVPEVPQRVLPQQCRD